ncbi:FadR/GntR family transcriptional regulator [Amycolatopsis sp.]|uniref:FadR/GntR family transcriptional regulator n=1 Tax=Amycolatopsis sp. TaxID=37632 RepID=UPI002CDF32B4|nr:GntR family transcriptional regulator [Amycolatopsis sp.]HVV10513.1 GntR family transcriptional regulator [Amycolatopsis sp.]
MQAEHPRKAKMSETIAVHIRRLIASGELREGEWLPTEPELMAEYGVSRPTLREAFRLLEGDSLVRVRRGPPGGAQVRLPGPEAVAPIFGLLLTLSGATLRDVYEARLVLEPPAARRLAEHGSPRDHASFAEELELARLAASTPETFGPSTVRFHQRMVELSGNRTLAAVVGMLGEVMTRHVAHVYRETRTPRAELSRRHRHVLRTYAQIVRLVSDRRGGDAQELWLRHMRAAAPYLLGGRGAETQVVELPE